MRLGAGIQVYIALGSVVLTMGPESIHRGEVLSKACRYILGSSKVGYHACFVA